MACVCKSGQGVAEWAVISRVFTSAHVILADASESAPFDDTCALAEQVSSDVLAQFLGHRVVSKSAWLQRSVVGLLWTSSRHPRACESMQRSHNTTRCYVIVVCVAVHITAQTFHLVVVVGLQSNVYSPINIEQNAKSEATHEDKQGGYAAHVDIIILECLHAKVIIFVVVDSCTVVSLQKDSVLAVSFVEYDLELLDAFDTNR
jgi:hypothetical protein